ncbi:MAG: hypothetical protein Q4C40_03300 [Eubacteriales bacterium]|nr:hypothetical protein [Eubacteriales bacterium]
MTSYSVPCGLHATDNDHFQLAELRIAEPCIPQFITGLRALLTGSMDVLRLMDARQKAVKAVIHGNGAMTFTLQFDNGSRAYFHEEDLHQMEQFALDRLFGKKKPNQCLSIQLDGEDDLQMGFGLWIVDT